MRSRATRTRRASALLPIFTFIATAHAEPFNYGVDVGVGETDNVTLAHDNKISQTIAVTDFDVDYLQKSQRLDAYAKGNFSYLDYLQNAYGNELLGRFDGHAELALVPQRFTWTVQDNFGQAAIDPFTPTTPNNLENINSFTTGPDLHLPLGGVNFVDMGARVARTQYESTPFTNTRISGRIEWGLKLSAFSSVSVNGDTERVLFENTVLNTDFDRSSGFIRYQLDGARTGLSAELGATVVDRGGTSTTGALARLNLTRIVSASARVTLDLGRQLIDGGTSFNNLQAGASGVVGTAPATNTSENYISTYGSVGWDYRRNRTNLAVTGRWEKDDYPGLPALDRTTTIGELRLERLLTRAFALRLTGRVYKSDYGNATVVGTNGSANNTTDSIAAALTWRHGRALLVKLACEHTSYSTSPSDTSYRENRVFFTVGYQPLRDAAAGAPVSGFEVEQF